ncbi:MAG: DnaJ domain-containing protein [Treponema sp.]|jgi:tetratricopeptide (TPR) repeat protein|nr:DnaJ domain-containing protein [Treponema sp.]
MKNHYEVLGIEKTADLQQIKRAYFGLVRQYPPEQFPEEFKELRAAYETLSDGKKRAEYDEIGGLPEPVANLFQQAQRSNRMGKHAQASDMYRTILKRNPELTKVQVEYAWSLEAEGKNGKATEVFEALYKKEPANPRYALDLAHAYDNRGWRRKAITQYWRTLEIDNSSVECWVSLITCHAEAMEWEEAKKICWQAIATVKEKNENSIPLYTYAFVFCAPDDKTAAEGYLKTILAMMREGPPDKTENTEMAIFQLMESLLHCDLIYLFPYIQEMVDLLPYTNKVFCKQLEELKRYFEIETLEEKGFSDLFSDLFITLYDGDDSEDDQCELTAMEIVILSEKDKYRPQLLRLKKEYPQLYALHESFFNEVLRNRNLEKMRDMRLKVLSKLKPTGFQNDEDWQSAFELQTVHRTEPKIGRNDPCPCGSGKKYKKCCGA